MFLLKRIKPIKLDFYTFDPAAFEYAQPNIGKPKPKWFSSLCPVSKKQAPNMPLGFIEKHPTVVYCPAIRGMVEDSINIPAWYETEIIINPDGSFIDTKGEEFGEKIAAHTVDQVGGEFYKDRAFAKLISPWKGVCNEAVHFMYTSNFYGSSFFDHNDIVVPPGYIEFKYQSATNVHLWFKIKPEMYSVKIPLKTPLLNFTPMSERELILNNHLVDFGEWMQLGSPNPKVSIGKYYKKLKLEQA